jgi:transforming growth factor-beta-induced protein
MKRLAMLALCVLMCVSLAACEGGTKKETAEKESPAVEPIAAPKDIVDVAIADGRFTTLVTAVKAAGLVETLKGEGPYTVFAPTDDAFAKLPAGTVESLLQDIPKLKNILLYHVVAGKAMAADVVKLSSATTACGEDVTIKVEGEKVMVDEANVIITDIEASNGVIHVIDAVILPSGQ